MTKLEKKGAVLAEGTFRHSSFVILSPFIIRISSFCIGGARYNRPVIA